MRKRIQRAKVEDTNIWVEGTYFPPTNTLIAHTITPDENEGDFYEYFTVTPKTVGDYTGVMDKHNTRVFEGDIVRIDEDIKAMFRIHDGPVVYGRGGFYINNFDTLNSLCAVASFNGVLRGEVIGNIHDNPELLEVK